MATRGATFSPAGPVLPGRVMSVRDRDARADYAEERLGLLARLFSAMGVFTLLAACIEQYYFCGAGPLARGSLDVAMAIHVALAAAQAVVWIAARQRRFGPALVPVIDLALVWGSLAVRGYEICRLDFGHSHQLELLMCMATIVALLCRAIVMPSAPWRTAVVGVLGSVPALVVAAHFGSLRQGAAETTTFCAIWCLLGVVISTATTRVIYGLRKTTRLDPQLGQYVLERKLGEGAMGEVYLARHTLLGRPTALKLLLPDRAGFGTVARFEREVRATSRLSHPNTVAIYDYGRSSEGIFYYAMEYLSGCDLQELVRRQGRLDPARVVHILTQVLGALHEAHAAGLVHRDLKPANIFLCERGGVTDTVKVLDFGLVKDTVTSRGASTRTDANLLLGTPAYLAPEAIHSPAEVDARSDIYAVGAIGYYLLTGREVFEGDSVVAQCIAHLHAQPLRPSARIGLALPRDLEDVLLSCLEKLPENRPQTAAALRSALLACRLGSETDTRPNAALGVVSAA